MIERNSVIDLLSKTGKYLSYTNECHILMPNLQRRIRKCFSKIFIVSMKKFPCYVFLFNWITYNIFKFIFHQYISFCVSTILHILCNLCNYILGKQPPTVNNIEVSMVPGESNSVQIKWQNPKDPRKMNWTYGVYYGLNLAELRSGIIN